ncbi:MAG: hypothetical protein ABEH43_02150 [Flavobacteriales bacterium]
MNKIKNCSFFRLLPVFTTLIIGLINKSSGQDTTFLTKDTVSVYTNSVFIELGGNGVDYTLNYDRLIYYGETNAVSLRVGGRTTFGLSGTNDFLLTAAGYYLSGYGNKFLEIGVAPIYSTDFSGENSDNKSNIFNG